MYHKNVNSLLTITLRYRSLRTMFMQLENAKEAAQKRNIFFQHTKKKEHTDRRRCGDALHTLSTSKLKTGEWMQQMLCYQFICFVLLLLVLNDLVFFLLFIRKQEFH